MKPVLFLTRGHAKRFEDHDFVITAQLLLGSRIPSKYCTHYVLQVHILLYRFFSQWKTDILPHKL